MEHLSLEAAILIEPGMDTLRGLPSEKDTRKWIHRLNSVINRRDVWEDLPSLDRWLRQQFPWKTWDKRAFDLYLVSLHFVVLAPVLIFPWILEVWVYRGRARWPYGHCPEVC